MAKLTIKVKSYLNIDDEKVANAALDPGHLIERISTDKVQKHATAGGPVFPMFAVEDAFQGRAIGDAYNTTTNAQVACWIPTRGDQVYAKISSSSEALVIGDFVESAGDGTLRKYDIASSGGIIEGAQVIVGRAIEAIAAGASGVIEII